MQSHRDLKKEALVKELYEKYSYPGREIASKKELEKYCLWVTRITRKEKSFWAGKEVLELGCGTGELANSLAIAGAKVKAIDFSNNSVKKAKELSKKFGTNVDFEVANILTFNSNKKYDVVIALGSLHHTINARSGFSIQAKHCKKEGIVVVGLYNKYSRFRHRVKRFVLRIFCGNNIEKRIAFGRKVFGELKSDAWLADKYGQVHESYHSVREVLRWFREEKIIFLCSKPKFARPVIDEIKWLLKKDSAFFVMVGEKK